MAGPLIDFFTALVERELTLLGIFNLVGGTLIIVVAAVFWYFKFQAYRIRLNKLKRILNSHISSAIKPPIQAVLLFLSGLLFLLVCAVVLHRFTPLPVPLAEPDAAFTPIVLPDPNECTNISFPFSYLSSALLSLHFIAN